MAVAPSAYWTSPSLAQAVWGPHDRTATLASAYSTAGLFSLLHRTCYSVCSQSLQYLTQDRGIYVLTGSANVHVEGLGARQLHAGDYLALPSFSTHSFNTSANTTFLELYTPGGIEGFDRGLFPPALQPGPAPTPPAIPPVALVTSIASSYGVYFSNATSKSSSAAPAVQTDIAAIVDQPLPYVTNATVAPAFWVQPYLRELWIVLAGGRQTGSAYTLTQITFSEGLVAAASRYTRVDESYYVLKGTATVFLDSQLVQVESDQFVFVPKGTVFAIRTTSPDFTALVIDVPSGIIETSLPLLNARPALERRLPNANETSGITVSDTQKFLLETEVLTGIVFINATEAETI